MCSQVDTRTLPVPTQWLRADRRTGWCLKSGQIRGRRRWVEWVREFILISLSVYIYVNFFLSSVFLCTVSVCWLFTYGVANWTKLEYKRKPCSREVGSHLCWAQDRVHLPAYVFHLMCFISLELCWKSHDYHFVRGGFHYALCITLLYFIKVFFWPTSCREVMGENAVPFTERQHVLGLSMYFEIGIEREYAFLPNRKRLYKQICHTRTEENRL